MTGKKLSYWIFVRVKTFWNALRGFENKAEKFSQAVWVTYRQWTVVHCSEARNQFMLS
jgi:hypothetical protein